jgi:ribosomal protein S18 acetylase RimI-like enzyme
MDYPTNFADDSQTYPVDKLGPVGRQAWQDLADKGYEVRVGLTKDMAGKIQTLSQEPSIREYCPKDYEERFSDEAATRHWLQKGRAMFTLLKDGQMAGYGWVGAGDSEQVPQGRHTFAIRLSEHFQGQGLAAPFMRLIISGGAILFGANDYWLEAWQSNAGAVHIYHKLGAVDEGQEMSDRKGRDGHQVSDIRLFLSLPNDAINP